MIEALRIAVAFLVAIWLGLLTISHILDRIIAKNKKEIKRQEEIARTILLCKHIIAINKGEIECEVDDPLLYEFFEKHITELSDNEICHSLRWAIKNEHYRIAALLQKHF